MRLRQAHLERQQQGELHVLSARVARGRQQIASGRAEEQARRQQRLRSVAQELAGIHRIELTQLECGLEAGAAAGKFAGLRESTFRRKAALLDGMGWWCRRGDGSIAS